MKQAIFGALRRQHGAAKLYRAMKTPSHAEPSRALLNSRLVKS